METVAAGDVVAMQDFFLPRGVKTNGRTGAVITVHANVLDIKENRQTRCETRGDQILDYLLLRVDRNRLASGEIVEVDAVAAAVKSKDDPVMGEAFALETLADSRFDEQIDRAMLKQTRADSLLDVFSAARFKNDGLDSLQAEQMGEDQPRWTCTDNSDLRAHRFPLVVQ
jgi:hypothetical protein